jgi:hypothetical protein
VERHLQLSANDEFVVLEFSNPVVEHLALASDALLILPAPVVEPGGGQDATTDRPHDEPELH